MRLCILALLGVARCAAASEYHGRVLFDGLPVPGATVTVTQQAKSLSTVTDSQGLYEFPDLPDGAWTIHIEMRGFAILDNSITVAPNASQAEFELKLLSLAEILAETHTPPPQTPALQPRAAAANPAPKKAATAPVLPTAPEPPETDDAERPNDGLLINGSESNAATSQFTLSPAFGNRRPGAKGLYTGGIGVIADNSVFDARPYSLSGLQVPKDAYNRVTMLVTVGGPIRIPHLFYHGPNFFLAYQWTRDRDATTASGLVPDMAERGGDLSGVTNRASP